MAFTPVCQGGMQCITDELKSWGKLNLHMAGVSCDSFAVLNAWSQLLDLKHSLLSDMYRQMCKDYGLYWPEMNTSLRATVIIGQDRKVIFTQVRRFDTSMNLNEMLHLCSVR